MSEGPRPRPQNTYESMPRDRSALIGAIVAALVGFSGVVVIFIVAPRYALWVLLAALFVTVPPILIVLRDMRSADGGDSPDERRG